MKITEQLDKIRLCERMAEAGKVATMDYYRRLKDGSCPNDQSPGLFDADDLKACSKDLENTYLIRIFIEFEITLRDYWNNCIRKSKKHTNPKISFLIDRVALKSYVLISTLQKVHAVREYRNKLIHGGFAPSLTLAEARSYLCVFLSSMPQQW